MKDKSILLAVSGSEQSKFAAELCCTLSCKLGCTVTAQHVLDTTSAWQFIGHDNPGFLQADRYLAAYESLCSSLHVLSQELKTEYIRKMSALGQETAQFVIEEGAPCEAISMRAAEHDMVVIGHKPTSESSLTWSQFMRLSTAEQLAHQCPRPLLIVQQEIQIWETLVIMISLDHINECFINSCLDFALCLGLRPAIICMASPENMPPDTFFIDFRAANARLEPVPISLANTETLKFLPDTLMWNVAVNEQPPTLNESSLLVVPTRELNHERVTIIDGSPAQLVRHLLLPAILLWPEEHTFSFIADRAREEVSNNLATI